jgi:ATP-dependent Clp protease adapter protein ClpS
MPTTQTQIDPDIEAMLAELSETLRSRRLVLFNDEIHDMLEVIVQVIRARQVGGQPCTPEEAKAITLEAHSRGQAVVMEGSLEPLKLAREMLESIELRCDILD